MFQTLFTNILWIATRAYEESRQTLTLRCQRATPAKWVKFTTALQVIKTIQDEEPKPLFNLLNNNYFEETRKPGCGYFFNNSHTQIGRQSIQKRLLFMRYIDEYWTNKNNPLSFFVVRSCVKSKKLSIYLLKLQFLSHI